MKISRTDLRERLLPIVTAQAIGLACGLLGVRLISRFVAPADYGRFGVFISLASIGVGVIYAGLVKFVTRHWRATADRAGLLREILAATRRKSLWFFGAVALVTLGVAPAPVWVWGALLATSGLLLALAQLAQSALQADRAHWRDLGVSAAMSVLRSFAPPLLYVCTAAGLPALLGGFALHAAAGVLLGALALRRWWTADTPVPAKPQLTADYDGPRFVTLALVAWLIAGLNRWLVAWRFGAEIAGYFTLAANIGAILPTMIGMTIHQFCQPQWFAAASGPEADRRRMIATVDRVAAGVTALAIVASAALWLALPWFIGRWIDARYAGAAPFLLGAALWTLAVIVGAYYQTLLIAFRHERDCLLVDLSGAAILALGSIGAALAGMTAFKVWLALSPLVPWLVNRTLAQAALHRHPTG